MEMWRYGLPVTLALVGSAAHAAVVSYDFAGSSNVGGRTRSFTGSFEYETRVAPDTVYYNGDGAPQQGFRTSYFGAMRTLRITLDNGESVVCGPGGYIDVNNIQQAEPGAQIPAGLTAQAWGGPPSGSINGQPIRFMYLAFLPMDPGFSWDALDGYFHGNAEAILQGDPTRLPRGINPEWTGTPLESSIARLSSGVFLGTIHGNTTTVNSITSFRLHVPAPGVMALVAVAAPLSLRRRR